MGCPTAVWQGLPVGALTMSCRSLREHERITPSPHLYFLPLRSSEAQRQGVIPFPPTSMLGKFPCGQHGRLGEVGISIWEEA